MHELRTSIDIDASAETVWSILVDFAAYEEWNPFIRRVSGTALPGGRLDVNIQGMTFRPRVLAVEPARELRWRGHLLFPGLFDGEHRFALHMLGARRVRFEQSERFSGLLAPIFRSKLERDTRRGFEEMNAALKQRAERAAAAA